MLTLAGRHVWKQLWIHPWVRTAALVQSWNIEWTCFNTWVGLVCVRTTKWNENIQEVICFSRVGCWFVCRRTTPCSAGLMWSGTLWRLRLRCWRTGCGRGSLCWGCPDTTRPATLSPTSCSTNSSSPASPTRVGTKQEVVLRHWQSIEVQYPAPLPLCVNN